MKGTKRSVFTIEFSESEAIELLDVLRYAECNSTKVDTDYIKYDRVRVLLNSVRCALDYAVNPEGKR